MAKDRVRRRAFLATPGLALSALAADDAPTKPVPASKDVTRILARFLVSSRFEDIPEPVRKEATRTLLNWVGCAVGGSHHATLDCAIGALTPFSGPPQSTVFGRTERFDVLHAALMNGISSHIFDFDDTHLRTIIHPAGPVASALLAFSEFHPVSGKELLHALILGVESECRIGNAVYPEHYDVGWHITGTVGPFGAAAAVGRLLKLSEQQMTWALGLAATQPVGLREMFGTMTKSFHPGRAAQNGLTAALLASKNYTSSNQALEAARGWTNVLSTGRRYQEITANLGRKFEISANTYKPFPCGIVIHPAIDAALQLRRELGLTGSEVDRVDLKVNPLVLELTGKKEPQVGLEAKFSVYHAVAAALLRGMVREKEFIDETVADRAIVKLRRRVFLEADKSVAEDQVRATITLRDGRRSEKYIEHAVGSMQNPMTDSQLEAKFRDLAEGILPRNRTEHLMQLCWTVVKLPDASAIAKAAASVA